jgi:flagellar L-ring protein precursor FlgH
MRLFPVISLLLLAMPQFAAAQSPTAPTLFDPSTYQGLVSDQKARKVGDALTVLVQESATASSSVDSNAARNADIALRGQTIGQKQRGLDIGLGANNDGGGQTVRSGRVAAQITVTVQAVEPNGELVVAGQQTVDLNGEKQVISVAGRVRPKDVLDNNAVLSSRLADARISYNGEGYIAEKSRPGVLSRVLHFLGL